MPLTFFSASQVGGGVRVTCDIQNCFHAATNFRLLLHPHENGDVLASDPPQLTVTVPPSQVVRATMTIPLRAPGRSGPQAQWIITASTNAGRGRRGRFRRRTAVTTRIHPVMTAAMFATGHVVHGSGTFLQLYPIAVNEPPDDLSTTPIWSIEPLWKPSASDHTELTQRV